MGSLSTHQPNSSPNVHPCSYRDALCLLTAWFTNQPLPLLILVAGWNVLDFVVVMMGYVGLMTPNNLTGIRTIRALRPLRTINRVKGMKVRGGGVGRTRTRTPTRTRGRGREMAAEVDKGEEAGPERGRAG